MSSYCMWVSDIASRWLLTVMPLNMQFGWVLEIKLETQVKYGWVPYAPFTPSSVILFITPKQRMAVNRVLRFMREEEKYARQHEWQPWSSHRALTSSLGGRVVGMNHIECQSHTFSGISPSNIHMTWNCVSVLSMHNVNYAHLNPKQELKNKQHSSLECFNCIYMICQWLFLLLLLIRLF